MENNFNENDKKKLIEFLNLIAEKADFSNLKIADIIKIYGSLSYVQKEILPKIESNILEVIRITESNESSEMETE